MQVNRKELLDALISVKPGLSKRDHFGTSTNFLFSGDILYTMSSHVSVITKNPLKGFDGGVSAEELHDVLKKLSTEIVDVTHEDGELLIKAGRARCGIRYMEVDEARNNAVEGVLAKLEKEVARPMPKDLLKAIGEASFCASPNSHDVPICGIAVRDGFVDATDRYRIFRYEVPESKGLQSFIFPAYIVKELLLYNPTKIVVTEGPIYFQNNDVTFVVMQYSTSANFPSVDQVMCFDGDEVELPQGLMEAMDKVEIFVKTIADAASQHMEVHVKKKRVVVKGQGLNGWYEESVPCEYDGEEFNFTAHPDFLRQIMPRVQRCKVGKSVASFDGDGFRYAFALFKKRDEKEVE